MECHKVKRILVISYYWPPAGGGGVQRITKFCKYLRPLGFACTVITGSTYHRRDESLSAEVRDIPSVRVAPLFDPAHWVQGQGKHPHGSHRAETFFVKIKRYLLNFIWLNCFIPDARLPWYLSARGKVSRLLAKESFDAVLTTGPPYTAHLIGKYLRNHFHLPWIADIRDPWVENAYYNTAYRFPWVRWLNKRLEKSVLQTADGVVTVGNHLASFLRKKVADKSIHVIYNGYDQEDFAQLEPVESDKFLLSYYGSMNHQQFPTRFLLLLAQELSQNAEFSCAFRFRMQGSLTPDVHDHLVSVLPESNLSIQASIPHEDLVKPYSQEQVFLLLVNRVAHSDVIITGKLFEYLYAGWPILGIGPVSGEAGEIIGREQAGLMCDHDAPSAALDYLLALFVKWQRGELRRTPCTSDTFDRSRQAKQLGRLLDRVIDRA